MRSEARAAQAPACRVGFSERAPAGDAPALGALPGGARRGPNRDGRHRQRAPRRGRRIVRRPSEGSAACGRGWAPAHSPQGNKTSRQLAPAGRLEGEPGFCTNGQRVCRLGMQRSTNKQPDAKAQAPFRGRLSFPAVERMGIRATDQPCTRRVPTVLARYVRGTHSLRSQPSSGGVSAPLSTR